MAPSISFKGASNFHISGGNFSKVNGDVKTINDNDPRRSSKRMEQLGIGVESRRRPTPSHYSTADRSNAVPRSSASTESLTDSGSSASDHSSTSIPSSSLYSTASTSVDSHYQPPSPSADPPGFDDIPLPQTSQPARPSNGLSGPPYQQPSPRVESRTSTLPPYSDRAGQSPQGSQNMTSVLPRAESRQYIQSPLPIEAHTTPRQYIAQQHAQQHSSRLYAHVPQQHLSPHYPPPQHPSP
ncbi:hypothetical protein P691DRAFT_778441, partial [Macrolepiota fuliginosa MF-IS2]